MKLHIAPIATVNLEPTRWKQKSDGPALGHTGGSSSDNLAKFQEDESRLGCSVVFSGYSLWLTVFCCPSESRRLLTHRDVEMWFGSFLLLGEVEKGLVREASPKRASLPHRKAVACLPWLVGSS